MDNYPVPQAVPGLPTALQQLDMGMAHLLTLLMGPRGCGKTTLLRRWTASRSWPAAWVALRADDNMPPRFLQHLVAATQPLAPGLLLLDGESVQDGLIEWLNALAAVPEEFALILDDYDAITAPPVHQCVKTVLDCPPSRLHLFIAARTEPPLPVPRLRVRRQLLEVRLTGRGQA
jgi:LuxR family maltose regulon positive regulatory protein